MNAVQTFRPQIGQSDFRALRRSGGTYVDKSAFIEQVIGSSAHVLLVPRPRRFGKTLNLSALRYFFEPSDEDRAPLFEGLAVWQSDEARPHFRAHPVISLSLKDVKYASWPDCIGATREAVGELFSAHANVLTADTDPGDRAAFEAIRARRAESFSLARALRLLSQLLHARHGRTVVLLVDEYDTPLHAAFAHGYYDEAVAFFRNFLSAGLKDNASLYRGVLTGILRIAKESIFSGLNNLSVYSLLRSEFSTCFGFTDAEVVALARSAGAPASTMSVLREWYDGYRYAGTVIYNPWSVLNFLDSADRAPRSYWASTGTDDVLRQLLLRGGLGDGTALETLLGGGAVVRTIDENIVLRDVERTTDAVWSFLLFSGYLTADAVDGTQVTLRIPNREVDGIFRTVFRRWLSGGLGGAEGVTRLVTALLAGNGDAFEGELERLVTDALSFHDVAPRQPEIVYQAFVTGLLVHLADDYDVRSNRESGFGRADVLVIPKRAGAPGAVLEFKSLDRRRGETIEQALDAAHAQIRDRDYAAELRARGAAPVHAIAAIFDGKRVTVRVASEGESAPASGRPTAELR